MQIYNNFLNLNNYVTESMKAGLIAFRQVLRKVGFNYLKCCSLPMAEAMCTEFHTWYNSSGLTFKTILKPTRQETSFLPL